jgi:hypothetical protein
MYWATPTPTYPNYCYPGTTPNCPNYFASCDAAFSAGQAAPPQQVAPRM